MRSHTNPALLHAFLMSSSVALKFRLRIITRQLFGLAPSHPPSALAHKRDADACEALTPTWPSGAAPPEDAPNAPSLILACTFCCFLFPTPGMARCSIVTAFCAAVSDVYTTMTTPRVAPSCRSFVKSTTTFGAGDRISSTPPHCLAKAIAASGSMPSGSPDSFRPAMATDRAARFATSAGCAASASSSAPRLRRATRGAPATPGAPPPSGLPDTETAPVLGREASAAMVFGASLSLSAPPSSTADGGGWSCSPPPPPPVVVPSALVSPFADGFCFAMSIVTHRPSILCVLLSPTAAAASSASANCTNPNPLLAPPVPFSATMNASLTGPISPNAASRPASVHVYGKLRTKTVVGPPIVTTKRPAPGFRLGVARASRCGSRTRDG